MKNIYNTKQRTELLKLFEDRKKENLSVKKIMEYLKENNIKIGMTTIYRLIGKLIEEGKIRTYKLQGDPSAYFELISDENEPYHCICNDCGKILHIECDEMVEMKNHIKNHHKFKVDTYKTTFYGTCEDCENGI